MLADEADAAWNATLAELDAYCRRSSASALPVDLPERQPFHAPDDARRRFISGDAPELSVGDERPLERDLKQIATGILALALAVATAATPALGLTLDDVRAALNA